MNIGRIFTASALVCLASASAFAQNKGMDLLKTMETKFQGVKSVRGSFTQKSEAPDTGFKIAPQNSTVNFQILKPGYFKAEYQDPKGNRVHLIVDKKYSLYNPALKQVNTYTFKNESSVNDLNFIMLGFGAKTADISKVYKVEAGSSANSVKLIPHNPQAASYKYITMDVDSKTNYPVSFSMLQTDNSKITVTVNLQNLQINPTLSPNDFQPTWDKSVPEVPAQ